MLDFCELLRNESSLIRFDIVDLLLNNIVRYYQSFCFYLEMSSKFKIFRFSFLIILFNEVVTK